MRLKWAAVWLFTALLVVAILYTLSLMFTDTHLGLTPFRDLGVSV